MDFFSTAVGVVAVVVASTRTAETTVAMVAAGTDMVNVTPMEEVVVVVGMALILEWTVECCGMCIGMLSGRSSSETWPETH